MAMSLATRALTCVNEATLATAGAGRLATGPAQLAKKQTAGNAIPSFTSALSAYPVVLQSVPLARREVGMLRETMALDPSLIEILACPKCKGALVLRSEDGALVCKPCKLAYSVVEDIPNLIIDDAQPL